MTGLPGRSVHGRARGPRVTMRRVKLHSHAKIIYVVDRGRKLNAFRKDRFTFSTCVIKRTRRDVIGDTVL